MISISQNCSEQQSRRRQCYQKILRLFPCAVLTACPTIRIMLLQASFLNRNGGIDIYFLFSLSMIYFSNLHIAVLFCSACFLLMLTFGKVEWCTGRLSWPICCLVIHKSCAHPPCCPFTQGVFNCLASVA